MSKAKSVGAHSICARGSLPCCKRTRADMESAPTFFAAAEPPRSGRCPAWRFLPLSETQSVGAHSICARGGLSCRKRARADMESAPTFFCGGRSPLAEAVPRVELSPFVESEIRRGAFYMRPRRFILPQAGTGGYGIRPYVFKGAAKGRVFACCACKRIYFRLRLVKNHLMWYTISLQIHRQTRCKPATQSYRDPSGQPVANKKLLFYCRR